MSGFWLIGVHACNPSVAEAETGGLRQSPKTKNTTALCVFPLHGNPIREVSQPTQARRPTELRHIRPKEKDIPTMSDHSRGPPGSTPETRRARALRAPRPGVPPRRRGRGRAPRARAAVTPQSAGGKGSRRFRGGGVCGRGSRASRSGLLPSSPPPSFLPSVPSVPGPEQPSAPRAP